jgi:hypothetical protein
MAVQFFEPTGKRSFAEKLSGGLRAGLETGSQMLQQQRLYDAEKQQQKSIQAYYAGRGGKGNIADLPPQLQKEIIASELQGDVEAIKQKAKYDYKSKLFRDLGIENIFGKEQIPEIGFEPEEERPRGILAPEFGGAEPEKISPRAKPEKPSEKKEKVEPEEKLYDPQQILAVSLVDQAAANHMQRHNDQILTDRRQKEKLGLQETLADKKAQALLKKQERDELVKFHEESKEYDQKLLEKEQGAKRQLEALSDIDRALKSGNVRPIGLANLFKPLGAIGELFSKAFTNKDQSTITSLIPSLLEGSKDLFGVRLSDADLAILSDKLPDIGKSLEANKEVIRIMKKYAEQAIVRGKIGADIKEKYQNLRPLGYAGMIEKRFDDMMKPIKIRNPATGNIIGIPAYKVGDAIKAGGELINE